FHHGKDHSGSNGSIQVKAGCVVTCHQPNLLRKFVLDQGNQQDITNDNSYPCKGSAEIQQKCSSLNPDNNPYSQYNKTHDNRPHVSEAVPNSRRKQGERGKSNQWQGSEEACPRIERLRSFLIVGINGPTPVIVGLRQKDKRTMAKNKSQLVWVLLLLLFMDVYK